MWSRKEKKILILIGTKLGLSYQRIFHTVEEDTIINENKEGEIVMINKVKRKVEEDELVQVSKKTKSDTKNKNHEKNNNKRQYFLV